jgi:hypothetical protein
MAVVQSVGWVVARICVLIGIKGAWVFLYIKGDIRPVESGSWVRGSSFRVIIKIELYHFYSF